ncbi:MAG: glycoside hydrolase family 43 protein [Segetibacter sp.]|nr:glycoside hydrolase family 43 protein [Segetibacter sp.]
MRKLLCACVSTIICFLSLLAEAQNGYKNPILPGFHSDPSVCRAGEDYYLVNSSFSYFPGIPIFHSKDLVNWEQIGHVLTTKEQLPLESKSGVSGISGGIYAPTIRYHKGTFYVISTNMALYKNFIVTAKDPKGPWSAPKWIEIPGLTIDPSLFFDDDGKVYISTSPNFMKPEGILMAQIEVTTGKLLTPLKSIWSGTGGSSPEGPHLYKKDGWYYLMIAEGGTEYGHKVTIARGKNIEGPYIANPDNPILTHTKGITYNSAIQGVGHADFVQATDSTWWTVALGFRPRSMHHILGRETLLAPVEWSKDGWPVINKTGTVALDMNVATLPLHPYPELPAKEEFNSPNLGFQWNYIGHPIQSNYSLSERTGYLRLTGDSSTLNQGKPVTFVGRRQEHETFTASALLDFKPTNKTDEAGLTVFMDFKHHYDLTVKNIDGKRTLLLTYCVGMIKHIENQIPLSESPVELKVEGSVVSAGYAPANYYTFSFKQGTNKFEEIAKAEAKYLSSETAGGFTGVYLGMFATGNGQTSVANADFDWFDYQHK